MLYKLFTLGVQAYRIEPLVLKHYSTIAPLKIHKLKEAKKVPYSEMKAKAFAAFGKAASQGTKTVFFTIDVLLIY